MGSSVGGYARLFLLPGVLHCSGGNGPDRVDWTNAIVDWVEKGCAPSMLCDQARSGRHRRSVPSGVFLPAARGVFGNSGNTDDARVSSAADWPVP